MKDFLRKIGVLRSGSATGTFTSAANKSDELSFDRVYDSKKDQVTKQDLAPAGRPHLMGMMILLISGLLGIFFVVGLFSAGGFSIWSILMVVLWLVFLWIMYRIVKSKIVTWFTLFGRLLIMLVISFVIVLVGYPRAVFDDTPPAAPTSVPAGISSSSLDNSTSTLTDSAILTQGETAKLAGGGSMTVVGATSNTPGTHGGYLYMGDGGATATFQIAAPSAGSYALWVRVDDDGKHANDTRSVSIAVGGTSNNWNHVSRNTNGWVYEKVGTYTLTAGSQTVVITKLKTTSAAFSMDEFILSADSAYQPK